MIVHATPFRLTIIHPCVGRRPGMKRYIRTWQMQPLPAGAIAALTPADVEKRFYDDRFEPIPYDEPTDLVAISIETYTAKRSYQIASEYRRRGVPVVMGGFHATLCPDEVQHYADSVVIGEAEGVFAQLIDDYRHGRPQRVYRAGTRPTAHVTPDRSIFADKPYRYLPIGLVEFARGCPFECEFCAIQSFFGATQTHRDIDAVLAEVEQVRRRGRMIFFVDDNIAANRAQAKQLMRALVGKGIRWVGQTSITAAADDELLELMRRSGCLGVLVGLESLSEDSLARMNKGFNLANGGPRAALEAFRRHGIWIYGTFVFGYEHDEPDTVTQTVDFACEQGMFIAAFAHLTPFPGTPLYRRLEAAGELRYERWWLDDRYRFNDVAYTPATMTPHELSRLCVEARRRFYSWPAIGKRLRRAGGRRGPFAIANFLAINAMHRWDVDGRDGLPLGDPTDTRPLLEVDR